MSKLFIDRTTPFNPAQFLGDGWSIWRGPAAGDGISGEEEQDERSLNLTQLDLSKIQLVTFLRNGEEECIRGEERLRRLEETGSVRLDAQIFQALWENKQFIPEDWKKKTGDCVTYIFFDGTTLRSQGGSRYVICLYWNNWGDGVWTWACSWREDVWDAGGLSAALAS